MLQTRLWMGAILAALTAGVLFIDQRLAPWFPFLLVFLLVAGLAATVELRGLLPVSRRPHAWVCEIAVVALIVANWIGQYEDHQAWHWIAGTFAGVVLSAFLVEMVKFDERGESVTRIALTIWIAAYLGLLPSFFAQLRWLPGESEGVSRSTQALALAIFVPKCCDIGAYFTGRLLGRHRMTPILSPKKTWEGFAGGMVTSIIVAIGLGRIGPALHESDWRAAGFGLTVGIAGVLGDLAESLIKRDCQKKDASQVVPGFGGVLDVVDAVIFAAPVAYWWLVD
ncbi:MAG TPA: phosphatidate cytidylyltransferase [Gemmataceae bacterium]|nr:phosphatidate cytidylyltransferase [Gemmataceae bacterium]